VWWPHRLGGRLLGRYLTSSWGRRARSPSRYVVVASSSGSRPYKKKLRVHTAAATEREQQSAPQDLKKQDVKKPVTACSGVQVVTDSTDFIGSGRALITGLIGP